MRRKVKRNIHNNRRCWSVSRTIYDVLCHYANQCNPICCSSEGGRPKQTEKLHISKSVNTSPDCMSIRQLCSQIFSQSFSRSGAESRCQSLVHELSIIELEKRFDDILPGGNLVTTRPPFYSDRSEINKKHITD
jgi:hypothetical protein